MISFTVRMTFREEDRQEIAEILENLTRLSRQEDGCVSYIPHTVEGDPNTVLIYEQYTDEAAAEFHRGTPHFAKLLERHVETLTAIA